MRFVWSGVVLAVWLSAAGCGEGRVKTYPVAGKVTFADGEPVRSGTVELESTEFGTTATGRIEDDGSFVLGTFTSNDGAAAGEHRAIVVQMIIADGLVEHEKDHGRSVDVRYGDYETSDLTVEVLPQESNQIQLTLGVNDDEPSDP